MRMQGYGDVYKWTILKRTAPEVKCLHPTSSRREMCTFSVSNVIYHKFSHRAAFYMLNGKTVNIMLELAIRWGFPLSRMTTNDSIRLWNLDPSYKMDLDFWDCLERKKTLSNNWRNMAVLKHAVQNSVLSDSLCSTHWLLFSAHISVNCQIVSLS